MKNQGPPLSPSLIQYIISSSNIDLLASLADLQIDYVDSFVIHWPQACPSEGKKPALCDGGKGPVHAHFKEGTMFPTDDKGFYCSDNESHYVETWHAMEALVDEGLAKTIGVSNFNRKQLQEVCLSFYCRPDHGSES